MKVEFNEGIALIKFHKRWTFKNFSEKKKTIRRIKKVQELSGQNNFAMKFINYLVERSMKILMNPFIRSEVFFFFCEIKFNEQYLFFLRRFSTVIPRIPW